jgi:hypothetical protein
MTMTDDDDRIPASTTYRGVPVHDDQPLDRIEAVVKPAIDHVHDLVDVPALFDFARDPRNPPEARLFAAAKVEAAWQLCAERRLQRPDVSLELLRACTAGLDSKGWRDPFYYCSFFDHIAAPPGYEGVPRRDPPLDD